MAKCNVTVSLSDEDRATLRELTEQNSQLGARVAALEAIFESLLANTAQILHKS